MIKSVLSTEELVKQYQLTNGERYFNQIVYNMDKLVRKLANQEVWGMDFDDIYSELLLELHNAIMNYNGEGKLTTVFTTYATRRIFKLRQDSGRDKRKGNFLSESLDMKRESGFDLDGDFHSIDDLELMESLEGMDLTERELELCKIVIGEKHRLKKSDIAKQLGVSNTAINYFLGNLRKKLVVLL